MLLPGEAGGTPVFPLRPPDAVAMISGMQFWGLKNPEAVSGLLHGGLLQERLAENGLLHKGRLREHAITDFVERKFGQCCLNGEYQLITKSSGWVIRLLRRSSKIVQPFYYYALCWLLGGTLEDLKNFCPHEYVDPSLKNNSSRLKNNTASESELKRVRKVFIGDHNARCHDKEGYYWLYRNDRDWLRKYVESNGFHGQKLPRIDWRARDLVLSREIADAYDALMKMVGKPIRVTKAELLRRVTCTYGVERNPSNLPQSAGFLKVHIESERDFQMRKIAWAVVELPAPHNFCLSTLMRTCGIRVLRLSKSEVDSLVQSLRCAG